MEVKVNALVLRAVDYGENDKILTLLTAELGKISAGIKGVKKAGAKLKFAAQPFCFAEYILACKGDRYTVIQASENESFYELRENILNYFAACAVIEAANALTYEGEECKPMFYVAIKALAELLGGGGSFTLIKFLIGALNASGYGVRLDRCAVCGAEAKGQDVMNFNPDLGSFVCRGCGRGWGTGAETRKALAAAATCAEDNFSDETKVKALKLLREYFSYKTESRCLSLSEYVRLL